MEERLERLEQKLDKMGDLLSRQVAETATNTSSLKEHMLQTIEVRKQTNLLKDLCDKLCYKMIEDRQKLIDKEITPLKTFVDRCKFALSAMGWLATVYALVAGLIPAILSIYKGH